MDEDIKKELEEIKTELVSAKIRLQRLEDFCSAFPLPSSYIKKHNHLGFEGRDELFDDAVKLVAQYDRASSSMLQRRLQVGFNRAARLLEQLEESGAVGPGDGSIPREVFVKDVDDFLKKLNDKK